MLRKIPAIGLLACILILFLIGIFSGKSVPFNLPDFLLGMGLLIFGIWSSILLLLQKDEVSNSVKADGKIFKKLTDFSYARTWKEALGFYLAYLLLIMLVSFLIGFIVGLTGLVDVNDNMTIIKAVGQIIAVIYVLIITIVIMREKKLYRSYGNIILAVFACILAAFGGGILGLIIPAYFTTLKKFEFKIENNKV